MVTEVQGRRCPRCGSTLITDGSREWCTFVGGTYRSGESTHRESPCVYGIDQPVKLVTLPQPTIPQDGRSPIET